MTTSQGFRSVQFFIRTFFTRAFFRTRINISLKFIELCMPKIVSLGGLSYNTDKTKNTDRVTIVRRPCRRLGNMLKIHHQASFELQFFKRSLPSCYFQVDILYVFAALGIRALNLHSQTEACWGF